MSNSAQAVELVPDDDAFGRLPALIFEPGLDAHTQRRPVREWQVTAVHAIGENRQSEVA
jgi:hypothetical protein